MCENASVCVCACSGQPLCGRRTHHALAQTELELVRFFLSLFDVTTYAVHNDNGKNVNPFELFDRIASDFTQTPLCEAERTTVKKDISTYACHL